MLSTQAQWHKSSRSSASGNCVEVRRRNDIVEVRDSRNRQGPVLSFTADAWRSFVAAVHCGEFDPRVS